MPRKKPTEKLGIYGQFDLNPESAVERFVESKLQNKFYIKPPYWDVPREGLELYAIQNERDHSEMSKLQDNLRKKAQLDERTNEERIANVYAIKNELRENFISVNDFIRECERKKTEAEDKLSLEATICNDKKKEIEKITKDLIVLTEFKERLEKSVDELQLYKTVFEGVVSESECFVSLKELIDRCDALTNE
ncbi:hypothetical protein Bhyg_16799 [Pseudolycoriella hygida]|uniref:DUF4200 domain-containing protein n=1 Tax=Pseudolycoriella hygida TaxID=35572 RepID=A0A9Q0RV53_9DIPT|nr:hypothetical protein Bhyg_16799 [Pseudolycoriella hygida]